MSARSENLRQAWRNPPLGKQFASWLKVIAARLAEQAELKRNAARLEALPDYLLRDINLTRNQFGSIVPRHGPSSSG
jgi:uncharacterized protein YjiS (DUF1127 family)